MGEAGGEAPYDPYENFPERIPFVDHILYTVVNQTNSYNPRRNQPTKIPTNFLENTSSGLKHFNSTSITFQKRPAKKL